MKFDTEMKFFEASSQCDTETKFFLGKNLARNCDKQVKNVTTFVQKMTFRAAFARNGQRSRNDRALNFWPSFTNQEKLE